MAAAPLIFAAISTVVSVVGALRQGKSEQASHNYNADLADRDAKIVRQQAIGESERISRENYLRRGKIIAAIGGAGIKQEGSAIDVLGDVVSQGELDKQNAIYAGELRSLGYTDTAYLERRRGEEAVTASRYKAGSALLGGATKGASQYGAIYGESKLTRT